jgi:hypothetical protein
MDIKFTPIDSDHIAGAYYDSMERRATIKFKNGSVYHVHGMLPDDYQAFMDAPSQGRHFHSIIKDNYHVERVK